MQHAPGHYETHINTLTMSCARQMGEAHWFLSEAMAGVWVEVPISLIFKKTCRDRYPSEM